jgi:ribosome maturation factor RimP
VGTEAQLEAVRTAVEPAVGALGYDLYDVELLGGPSARTLRVTITNSRGGIDLDAITQVTQAVSPLVDDADAINGSYLLEVSSPGVERPLRRPEHYTSALGEQVSVKFHTEAGPRRVHGALVDADQQHCVVEADDGARHDIALNDVTQARTVFEWGPQPRPGKGSGKQKARARAKGTA